MTAPARPTKQQKKRGRRRAWMSMRLLTGLCVVAALGIGATQLASNGLATFVNRPEGVGATPDAEAEQAAPAPRPNAPARNPGRRSAAANPTVPDLRASPHPARCLPPRVRHRDRDYEVRSPASHRPPGCPPLNGDDRGPRRPPQGDGLEATSAQS